MGCKAVPEELMIAASAELSANRRFFHSAVNLLLTP